MKSLQAQKHQLSNSEFQLTVLNGTDLIDSVFPSFKLKLSETHLYPLKPVGLQIMQINIGKMCNQTCKHCHVDAGPDRKEIMTRQTMQFCLDVISETSITTVDLTGGAPEMNPDFRWFVEQLHALGCEIIVRCNLTILVANKKYNDLPEFFKKHNVQVVSSLPYFSASRTDAQRGDGVFERSIKALKMLNEVGYGIAGSGLTLDLVYNPSGAFLPGNQQSLEADFKKKLKQLYDIDFNQLFCITNLPISRFLDYLLESENYESYMQKLVSAFNAGAAENVMCRNMLSVSWDGWLFDCDFNQMLDLKVNVPKHTHISNFNHKALLNRSIVLDQHCYGCTAGAGSSCGGATVT